MKNNYFKTGLKAYSIRDSIEEAEEFSYTFLSSALRREYEKATDAELAAFIRSGLDLLGDGAVVNVLPGEQMPLEARIDFIHTPTYAVAAVGMYLMLKAPAALDEVSASDLHRVMEILFSHPIPGHGYDADNYRMAIVLMLCQAGAAAFAERYPDFCPALSVFLSDAFAYYGEKKPVCCSCAREDLSPYYVRLLAAKSGCVHPVFVYGTLMKGERASDRLAGAFPAGTCYLKDYAVYDLGAFPGIRPLKGESVLGELYFVNEETLRAADAYEGEGSLYLRTGVTVYGEHFRAEAEAYVYGSPVSGQPLPGGRWNRKGSDRVWYACYGSNLSADRFKAYILGAVNPANGIRERGCTDKSLWTDSRIETFPGRLYFAKQSRKWERRGVAFYDPEGRDDIIMRLYNVTSEQYEEIKAQEGGWYSRKVLLGLKDGLPVYTFTSPERYASNAPDESYLNVIRNALMLECGIGKTRAERYLKRALKN